MTYWNIWSNTKNKEVAAGAGFNTAAREFTGFIEKPSQKKKNERNHALMLCLIHLKMQFIDCRQSFFQIIISDLSAIKRFTKDWWGEKAWGIVLAEKEIIVEE